MKIAVDTITIQKLIGSLESKCEVALNWFNENKMIENPGKFQTIQTKSSKLVPKKLKLHLFLNWDSLYARLNSHYEA